MVTIFVAIFFVLIFYPSATLRAGLLEWTTSGVSVLGTQVLKKQPG